MSDVETSAADESQENGATVDAGASPRPYAVEGERRAAGEGPDRRLTAADRRSGLERRTQSREDAGYSGPERRVAERRDNTGLERRRGPGRRRSDERREAEEGEMNVEQFEFVMAIEAYKKINKRLYPTWTEILEVVNQLGYRKVLPRSVRLDAVPEPELSAQPPKAA